MSEPIDIEIDIESEAEPETVAEALVDELHTEGELVEAGAGFSIDASRALAKLRQYQLADARAYVLLLVEAAILAGAEEVPVTIGVDGVRIGLGPLHIDRDTLEQLFAAVFVSLDGLDASERRRRRALHKLALAANAALSLEPSEIVIECPSGPGPAATGLRLSLSPEASLGVVTELDAPTPARVHVHLRALEEIVDDSPEAQLLRQRCAYARVPITLDGARISQSLERALHTELSPGELSLSVRARKLRAIEIDGEMVGFAALRYGGGLAPELMLVTNGVLAETLSLDEGEHIAARDFMAIVDIDLAKDLGQAKLLRDPSFDAVLAAVWQVHDAIAPRGAPEASLTDASLLKRAKELDTSTLLIPIAVLLLGLALLWGAIEDGGADGMIVMLFAAVMILGGAYGIVRALSTDA